MYGCSCELVDRVRERSRYPILLPARRNAPFVGARVLRVSLRQAHRTQHDLVHRAVIGSGLWSPPQRSVTDDSRLQAALLHESMSRSIGVDAAGRLDEYDDSVTRRLPPHGDYWYLGVPGSAPAGAGHGHGRAVMEARPRTCPLGWRPAVSGCCAPICCSKLMPEPTHSSSAPGVGSKRIRVRRPSRGSRWSLRPPAGSLLRTHHRRHGGPTTGRAFPAGGCRSSRSRRAARPRRASSSRS